MNIAFYAPLKSPRHAVPSGDRQVARLLIAALEQAGHRVRLISELRAYLPDPDDTGALARLQGAAAQERDRIARLWADEGAPDLWFCYHPYYKSPDLIGPDLARRFGLPWVSAEASLSARRGYGIWAQTQAACAAAIAGAAMNFAMTARDRTGLCAAVPGVRITALAPFIAADPRPPAALTGNRLVSIAMMRPGDKMDSYRALAEALARLPATVDWQLDVAGDGPCADAVRALFPPGRVTFHGQMTAAGVADLLALGAVYVWPGCGEAYGLAYLEAQAAGLPVVAWATAGVPEVVRNGETGLLAPAGDVAALAGAVERLLGDPSLRREMGRAARARVGADHQLAAAAERLDTGLKQGIAQP